VKRRKQDEREGQWFPKETIECIEQGLLTPDNWTAIALAGALGVTVEDLHRQPI
jgi:DNA-binding XRE family transcriptional regulator